MTTWDTPNDLRLTLNTCLTIKSILHTPNTYPEAQIIIHFALQPGFLEYKVIENRKSSEFCQTDLENLSQVPCIHWILTPEAQMFIRFVRPGIFDTRLSKIGNALNDPRLTLNAWLSKLHCINWILTPDAQILIHFAVQSGLTYRYKVAENHREMAVRDPCEWLLGQPPLNWLTNQSQKWLLQLPPCGYFPNQTPTSWKSPPMGSKLSLLLL